MSRDHCKGSGHLKRALQAKLEYNKKNGKKAPQKKKEAGNNASSTVQIQRARAAEEMMEPVPKKDRSRSPVRRAREDGQETNRIVDQDISSVLTSVEEENIGRLHLRVVQAVKEAMNKYYPPAPGFVRGLQKIRSEGDYFRTAERFSNDLREKIIASYRAFNNIESLEGIKFTADHKLFIETEIDSYFETLPVTH